MFRRSTRHFGIAIAVVVLSGTVLAPGARAAGPDHFGPFAWSDTIYFSCGTDFDVRLDTQGTESFTIWSDDNGDVDRVLYRVRAPRDVFTNL